jgi:shikimate dehydrogenase
MRQLERFNFAGVMGDPISHSRSPLIHNYWLRQHGLQGAYVPLHVRAGGLGSALRALPALCFSGCNLTIPHKEAALALVDFVDPLAQRIGAINCVVVRGDGALEGRNYDAFGFTQSIREHDPNFGFTTAPAVVLGAGGASRAVLAGLVERGAREIRLLNRTRSRAEALAKEFGPAVHAHDWEDRARALTGAGLLVNTTNQGMVGQSALDLALATLPMSALVVDIVYAPLETPLLAAARARGNGVVDGLGMLLNQARPAFEAWFGVLPDVTPDLRKIVESTL